MTNQQQQETVPKEPGKRKRTLKKRPQDRKTTAEYLKGKGLVLHSTRHQPIEVASPQRIRVYNGLAVECLEEILAEVEAERLKAMLRYGDDNGFKKLIKPAGVGLFVAYADVWIMPTFSGCPW